MKKTKDAREKNTMLFLKELTLQKELEKLDVGIEGSAEGGTGGQQRQAASELVSPFDWLVKDWEIRLLAETGTLTYGAVLPWDWNHALLIPFSHNSHPATDEEMYASDGESRGMFQQVYQVWNARTVNRTVLAKSWVHGMIPEEDKAALNQMLRHRWLGAELSPELSGRTGIPLLEGKDIRKKYLEEELANFSVLDAADAEAEWAQDELEAEHTVLSFDALRGESELQAAAGRNLLSEAYVLTKSGLKFLRGIELTDFEKVPAGNQLPHFCWLAESLPESCRLNMQVLFRSRKTGQILGSGILLKQKFGYEIVLANPIEPEDTPELNSPTDIQVILCC
ncbi:MAG: hypothetical protein IKO93_12155 [Lentisphaeria bacterium]|nr:hypothetical protein [Lentisphaeria bacterium]